MKEDKKQPLNTNKPKKKFCMVKEFPKDLKLTRYIINEELYYCVSSHALDNFQGDKILTHQYLGESYIPVSKLKKIAEGVYQLSYVTCKYCKCTFLSPDDTNKCPNC